MEEMLKKLTPQHKLIIGIAFLGVVAGLFYYLIIMELDAKIQQQKVAYGQAQKALEEFKGFEGEVEKARLLENSMAVKKQIARNLERMPAQEDLPRLMADLEADAIASGLVVQSKEQKKRQVEPSYYKTPMAFEVRGSYLELVKFLTLIGTPDRKRPDGQVEKRLLVNVNNLDIKMAKERQRKEKQDASSPFVTSGKMATADSLLTANMIISGFTYTAGEPDSGKGQANK